MINVNDFKTGQTINYDGNLYQVLEFNHVKPGKGAAIVKAKLKNLNKKDAEKLKDILSDENKMRTILESDAAKALFEKLTGGKTNV